MKDWFMGLDMRERRLVAGGAGVLVGRTSSGMYGHTFGTCLAMGYLNNDAGVTEEWIGSGTFEIEVATVRVPATASLRPFYRARIHT